MDDNPGRSSHSFKEMDSCALDQTIWISLKDENNQGSVASYDLNTLTHSFTLRDCSCAPHGLVFDDRLCPSTAFVYNTPVSAIQAYAVNRERAVHRFFGHAGISCMNAFGVDGNMMLVAGMQDGSVSVWDTTTGDMRAHIPNAHMASIKMIASNPQVMVTCSKDTILVHKVESVLQGMRTPLWELRKHRKGVSALHLGMCARAGEGVAGRLWSGGEDGEVWVWDIRDGSPLACLALPSPVTSLAVSMTETVCYASSAQGIHVLDVSGSVSQPESMMHCKDTVHLALSLDETLLVSVTGTASITIWDVFTRQPLRSIDGIANGGTVTNLTITSKPFENATPPQVGILKRTISENAHPLTTARVNIGKASIKDDSTPEEDWKSKYDALAIKYNELEALNQELHQLVKE